MQLISALQMANYWLHSGLQGGEGLVPLTVSEMMMKKIVRPEGNANNASLGQWLGQAFPWQLAAQ